MRLPLQTFKRPLSPSEEAHYLALSRQGDLNARNTLVEYNLRLVAHIVKNIRRHTEASKIYFP